MLYPYMYVYGCVVLLVCDKFSSEGFHVILLSRNLQKLEKIRDEIIQKGQQQTTSNSNNTPTQLRWMDGTWMLLCCMFVGGLSSCYSCDVCDDHSISSVFAKICELFPAIHILIYNAAARKFKLRTTIFTIEDTYTHIQQ